MHLEEEWAAIADKPAFEAVLVDLVDKKLADDNTFYSRGGTPTLTVLGARRIGSQLELRFAADAYNYCLAQSGSDWADHYFVTGSGVFEGTTLVRSDLAVESTWMIERDTEDYDVRAASAAHVEEARGKLYTPLQRALRAGAGKPVVIEPTTEPTRRLVRCPECGSTSAGAIDHMIEITTMWCGHCGHWDYVDDFQLGSEWNVDLTLPIGTTELPAFVATASSAG